MRFSVLIWKEVVMATITFRMDANKDLIATTIATIYQQEKNIDSVAILLPQFYNDIDLGDFKVELKYADFTNALHTEELTKDTEMYKDTYYRYIFPITEDFTQIAGDIRFMIAVSQGEDTMLHTGSATISIRPWKDYKIAED